MKDALEKNSVKDLHLQYIYTYIYLAMFASVARGSLWFLEKEIRKANLKTG